jgi:hypothetical protein
MELVDPQLGSELNKEEAIRMIKVALLCINPSLALTLQKKQGLVTLVMWML